MTSCSTSNIHQATKTQGFTLLELLVVIVILSSVSLLALTSVTSDINQTRFERTKDQIRMIQRAIAGPPPLTSEHISGFVADMGRLPGCLLELIAPTQCTTGNDLPLWSATNVTGIAAGWRGPYLPNLDGAFRDGWSNVSSSDDGDNFGWDFNLNNNQITLKSFGLDGQDGPAFSSTETDPQAIFSMEYPPETLAGEARPIITENDVFLNLSSEMIRVRLFNNSDADIPIAENSLCIAFFTPTGAVLPELGTVFITQGNAATTIPANSSTSISFTPITGDNLQTIGVRGVQLRQHNGTECTATPYNNHPIQILTLRPRTAIADITWSAQ